MKHSLLKASLLLLPLTLGACMGDMDGNKPPCPMDRPCPNHHGMMHGMPPMMAPTGDADVDYVRGMIPHHQMAVDESEKYLAVGHDAEIRRLAGHIEKSQQREISMMNEWLDKRGMAVDEDNMPGRPMHHRWMHDDGMPRPAMDQFRDPSQNDRRGPAPNAMQDTSSTDTRDPRAAAAPAVGE